MDFHFLEDCIELLKLMMFVLLSKQKKAKANKKKKKKKTKEKNQVNLKRIHKQSIGYF